MSGISLHTLRLGGSGWALVLSAVMTAALGRAASFSADMAITEGGQAKTGRFSFQDQSYRCEVAESAQSMVMTVDGKTGEMYVILPSEKMFYKVGPDSPMVRAANPFGAYAYYAGKKEVKTEGAEPIDGMPCTKRVVSENGQVLAVAWVSDEFGFPLKAQTTLPETSMELRNIKRGPQDASLFSVPAGYKELALNAEPPPPEWAGQVSGAPALNPPCEKTLAEGDIVRIPAQAGRKVKIRFAHAGGDASAFTAVSFKGGKPLGSISGNTMNLSPGQDCQTEFAKGPDEVDDYVIRIRKGSVTLTLTAVGGSAPAGGEPTAAAAPAAGPAGDAAPEAQIAAAPQAVGVADRMEIAWNGPADRDDFISVAKPGSPGSAYVSQAAVRNGNPSKLLAPSDPGEYEIRYVRGKGGRVLAKAPLTVNPETAGVEAAGSVDAAAWLEVKWQGPARDGDYVSVARLTDAPGAYVAQTPVRNGNPVRLRAPSDPGAYEVRYILGRGARLLAKAPVTVTPVSASVQAPASAKAGTEFEVTWKGPGYEEDYVTVARANQGPGAYLSHAPTRRGNPLKIRAPKEPGAYEVRYVLGRGNRLLGTAAITVEAP